MRFLAPAKVNLHLRILGRRPDGYHEIQSLMRQIGLFDEIEIEPGEGGIRLERSGEEVPAGMENLACKAARIFCQARGVAEAWRIRLRKRIPVASGLGGGSSDAAAVLMGLNDMIAGPGEGRWERERLMEMGAKIGADLPFFIFGRPAQARGIGEDLEPVEMPESLWFLLVIPPFRISTAWAYEAYDRLSPEEKAPLPLRDSYRDLADLLPVLQNDLERAAVRRFPSIARIKEELLVRGARGALMSGSGSAVFGLFPTEEEAQGAQEAMTCPSDWKTFVGRGL